MSSPSSTPVTIVHIHVHVPCILPTIREQRLFRSELPIVWLLFEGDVYLKKYSSCIVSMCGQLHVDLLCNLLLTRSGSPQDDASLVLVLRPSPSFSLLAVWLSERGPGTFSHVSDVPGRKMVERLQLNVGEHN